MTASHAPTSSSGRGRVLALLCAIYFLVILDAAIVRLTLPSLHRALGLSAASQTWVANAYMLSVAHAFRVPGDPPAAELAAMVADAHQRRGLGTNLLDRLAARAAAVGIERLIAHVLSDSGLAERLVRRGWHVTDRDGGVSTLVADVARAALSAPPLEAPLHDGSIARSHR